MMSTVKPNRTRCPNCNQPVARTHTRCPECGHELAGEITMPVEATMLLTDTPAPDSLAARQGTDALPLTGSLLLHLVQTSGYLSLPLRQPVIVGRSLDQGLPQALDLSEMGGQEYGVSRRHCRLRRRGKQVVVTDLGSSNGTFLNGERLVPQHDAVLHSGDELILGALRIHITFAQQ